MKTHELAKALNQLSRLLRSFPNIDLSELALTKNIPEAADDVKYDSGAFYAFIALSSLSKNQWVQVVEQYELPVEIKKTDSARDLVGRIMRYFNDNPKAREQFRKKAEGKPTKASPELMKALDALLKG